MTDEEELLSTSAPHATELTLAVVVGDARAIGTLAYHPGPVVVVTSLLRRELAFNEPARDFFGLGPAETRFAIKRHYKLLDPDELEHGLARLRAGEATSTRLLLRDAGGAWNWYQLSARALPGVASAAHDLGIVLSFVPCATARDNFQESRNAQQRARLGFLWDADDVGVFTVDDTDTESVSCNEALFRMLGRPVDRAEMPVSHLLDHIDDERAPDIRESFTALLDGSRDSLESDFSLGDLAGEHKNVHLHAHAAKDDGGVRSVIGIVLDTDERHRAQSLAVASIRELESFTYSISHDLRAPVRHVESFTNLLLESAHDRLTDEELEFGSYIRDSAGKLAGMIQALVEYSRLPKHAGDLRWVSATQIAEHVLETSDLPQRLRVVVGRLPEVKANPALLETLLRRLVGNAAKFSAEVPAPKVWIEPHADESGRLGIRIRDNGVGFDERHADKLFSIFQRLHSIDEFPGVGIGLAVVKRIADLHDGRIEATSVPNQGATFSLYLPYTRPSAPEVS